MSGMIRALVAVGLVGLVPAGCDELQLKSVAGVVDALPAQVAGCRYVTDLRMTPGTYGPVITDQALRLARNKVMADAKAAGANSVVFAPVPPSGEVYLIQAKAYAC